MTTVEDNDGVEHAVVNVNGVIGDSGSAVVSVFDHGFLYGEGIYETLRTYNQKPFLLERHLRRLRGSAEMLGLTLDATDADLTNAITATTDCVTFAEERYVRMLVTRGVGDLSYDPTSCQSPTIVVIVKPHRENDPDVLARGIRVIRSSVIRNHPDAINPRIKSNNLLNSVLAMQEAIRAGASEAVMRNHQGEISECAQSNVFIIRDGVAHTPPLDAGLLEGVTRNFVFDVARLAGVPVFETTLRDVDLLGADEMFVTSTTREILPVTRLDDEVVGTGSPGPVTRVLATAFHREARRLSGVVPGDG